MRKRRKNAVDANAEDNEFPREDDWEALEQPKWLAPRPKERRDPRQKPSDRIATTMTVPASKFRRFVYNI